MSLPITAAYGGILALIMVALAINVTVHRAKLRVPLGDGGDPVMLRMIRMHGNAVEYLPLALVLMAIYEANGGWRWALNITGIALVIARLLQTWNMWNSARAGFGRIAGQSLTWLSVAALAVLNIVKIV
jgi:hypothetical protein